MAGLCGAHRTTLVRLSARAAALAVTLVLVGGGLLTAGGASPSDPAAASYFSEQWGLAQINAPSAWRYGTGAGVRIGIVDTGVDLTHPDLAGKVVAAATCINTGGNPAQCSSAPGAGQDDNGHGTDVAGIAAAWGLGVAGVAPGASLVVAKVLDSRGSGNVDDVSAGIEWVVAHGARVVNLSLGSDAGFMGLNCVLASCGPGPVTGAVEAAWQAGAIPVIAAGNNAGSFFGPRGYGDLDAVVVAATGPQGQFAGDYSSTPGNAKWGVLAPGGDDPNGPTSPTCGTFDPSEILSTYWSGTPCYATDEGTSMATPFVSGTLALLLGRGLDQQQAVQTLLSTLDTSTNCGSGQGCQGLVDAGAAMAEAARTAPRPPPPRPPAPSLLPPNPSSVVGSSSQPASRSPSSSGSVSTATSKPPTVPMPTTTSAGTAMPTAVGLATRSSGSGGARATGVSRRGRSRGDGPWLALFGGVAVVGGLVAGGASRRRSRLRGFGSDQHGPPPGGR